MFQRKKRQRRGERVSARRWLTPGRASEHILSFPVIKPGDRIVMPCRESTKAQERRGNLDDQESYLRLQIEGRGAKVVGVIKYVGTGADPYWLARAVALARKHKANFIVAESTDRFIRHPCWNKHNQDLQPRPCDFEDLMRWADGVPLVTFLHPDTPFEKVKSHQSHRGQSAKGRRGGRPVKIRRKGLSEASEQQQTDFQNCWNCLRHILSGGKG
jgi:hypothetical protein